MRGLPLKPAYGTWPPWYHKRYFVPGFLYSTSSGIAACNICIFFILKNVKSNSNGETLFSIQDCKLGMRNPHFGCIVDVGYNSKIWRYTEKNWFYIVIQKTYSGLHSVTSTLIISEIGSQKVKISSIPETFDKYVCRYSKLNKKRGKGYVVICSCERIALDLWYHGCTVRIFDRLIPWVSVIDHSLPITWNKRIHLPLTVQS